MPWPDPPVRVRYAGLSINKEREPFRGPLTRSECRARVRGSDDRCRHAVTSTEVHPMDRVSSPLAYRLAKALLRLVLRADPAFGPYDAARRRARPRGSGRVLELRARRSCPRTTGVPQSGRRVPRWGDGVAARRGGVVDGPGGAPSGREVASTGRGLRARHGRIAAVMGGCRSVPAGSLAARARCGHYAHPREPSYELSGLVFRR